MPIRSTQLLGQLLVDLLDVRDTGRAVVDHRVAPVGVELGVGAAAQRRRRVADPSGVEAHQVEMSRDLGVLQVACHRRRPCRPQTPPGRPG